MERVAVVGTGYVGLVLGAGLAEIGHQVVCADVDKTKIDRLRQGEIPIYEPGLETLVSANTQAGRLSFTTDVAQAVRDSEIVFIAVGTPPAEDGSADLSHVLAVADTIAEAMDGPRLVVNKSTVPVGTARRVYERIRAKTSLPVDVASNPEFLREGSAVRGFLVPDRIVIGADSDEARNRLVRLYAPLARTGARIIAMDVTSAELTKYTANTMLALRISFMNLIAQLCERVGADIEAIREGVGTDNRIGPAFLRAGCGFGGSCFPKDVQALMRTMTEHGVPNDLLTEIIAINERQKEWACRVLDSEFGTDWTGQTIAVWGLAFKPGTDDMREAPSITFLREALNRGATIRAHDPVAIDNARAMFGDAVEWTPDALQAAEGADAIVLLTDWGQYTDMDPRQLRERCANAVILDGRNALDASVLREAGFRYVPISRPRVR